MEGVVEIKTYRINRITTVIAFIIAFSLVQSPMAGAETTYDWSPFSQHDYIYGYSESRYSCWQLGDETIKNSNFPSLQVLSNGQWKVVAKGILLPTGTPVKEPCTSEFPLTIGYKWTITEPQPPIYRQSGDRYRIQFRQVIEDLTLEVRTGRFQQIPKTETYSDLVPYKKRVKKKGKWVKVTRYREVQKTKTTYVSEEIIETRTIPGFISQTSEMSVWPSVGDMNAGYAKIGRGILCSWGFKENC